MAETMRCPICAGAPAVGTSIVGLGGDDVAGENFSAVLRHYQEEHDDGKPIRVIVNGRVLIDEWTIHD